MVKTPTSAFDAEAAYRRKLPQQMRAEQTVERIKRATLELIAEEGFTSVSTNRIAKRARVNISSLYQYFPNRLSIALAIYEDAAARQAQVVHDVVLESLSRPVTLEASMERLMRAVLDFLEREEMALLRLVDEVPELRHRAKTMALENLSHHGNRLYIAHHLGIRDEATLQRKQFFVELMGLELLRRYVLDRPEGIDRDVFITELAESLVLYLRKPPPQIRKPARAGRARSTRRAATPSAPGPGLPVP